MRRRSVREWGIMKLLWILLFLIVVGIGYLLIENKRLAVTNYQICQKQIPKEFDGLRMVLLTDLHNNRYGKKNTQLLRKIAQLKPDLVCVSGDMITASQPQRTAEVLTFLLQLSEQYPVFYSLGNHEEKWKRWDGLEPVPSGTKAERAASRRFQKKRRKSSLTYEQFKQSLVDAGVFFLDNSSTKIKKGNDLLTITGLSLPLEFYYKKGSGPSLSLEELSGLIGSPAKDGYHILLAHMPKYFKEYASWGADLVLSGHVHGGIMILPWLGGVISPQYELFPAYDFGYFEENTAKMLLSRGLGTHTIPIRIFNRPELIGIELKKRE